jgi:hypothetical protein
MQPSQSRIAEQFLRPRVIFAAYAAAALIVTLAKLAQGPFEQSGFHYQPLENFAIFRNSFFHLIHHQNLYATFRYEQWDYYRYSPTFALLFAPFALLPYAAGAVLWNLANAGALFWAVWSIPEVENRRKALALWFVFLAMLNSVSNAQSNALVAALMIGAWNAQARSKPEISGLLIALSMLVKLFGILALLPCLVWKQRRPVMAYTAGSLAVLGALPLLVSGVGELGRLYGHWFETVRAFNQARLGISFMGFLDAWLRVEIPSNAVVAVGAIVLIAIPLLGRGAWLDSRFQRLAGASVLIFATIFNYAAESPSYVIAIAGVAIWYFFQPPTAANTALAVAAFLLSELSSTDLFPRALRRQYLEPYVIKALPCIVIWFKIQYDLVRFPKPSRYPEN